MPLLQVKLLFYREKNGKIEGAEEKKNAFLKNLLNCEALQGLTVSCLKVFSSFGIRKIKPTY